MGFGATAFGFAMAFLTTVAGFGVEAGFLACAFFAAFLTAFLAVFFAKDRFAVFPAFFAAVFFDFFVAVLLFFARFFDARALAARFATFFAFFFFEGFLLATTNSLQQLKRGF
jgi:hypothetical protein